MFRFRWLSGNSVRPAQKAKSATEKFEEDISKTNSKVDVLGVYYGLQELVSIVGSPAKQNNAMLGNSIIPVLPSHVIVPDLDYDEYIEKNKHKDLTEYKSTHFKKSDYYLLDQYSTAEIFDSTGDFAPNKIFALVSAKKNDESIRGFKTRDEVDQLKAQGYEVEMVSDYRIYKCDATMLEASSNSVSAHALSLDSRFNNYAVGMTRNEINADREERLENEKQEELKRLQSKKTYTQTDKLESKKKGTTEADRVLFTKYSHKQNVLIRSIVFEASGKFTFVSGEINAENFEQISSSHILKLNTPIKNSALEVRELLFDIFARAPKVFTSSESTTFAPEFSQFLDSEFKKAQEGLESVCPDLAERQIARLKKTQNNTVQVSNYEDRFKNYFKRNFDKYFELVTGEKFNKNDNTFGLTYSSHSPTKTPPSKGKNPQPAPQSTPIKQSQSEGSIETIKRSLKVRKKPLTPEAPKRKYTGEQNNPSSAVKASMNVSSTGANEKPVAAHRSNLARSNFVNVRTQANAEINMDSLINLLNYLIYTEMAETLKDPEKLRSISATFPHTAVTKEGVELTESDSFEEYQKHNFIDSDGNLNPVLQEEIVKFETKGSTDASGIIESNKNVEGSQTEEHERPTDVTFSNPEIGSITLWKRDIVDRLIDYLLMSDEERKLYSQFNLIQRIFIDSLIQRMQHIYTIISSKIGDDFVGEYMLRCAQKPITIIVNGVKIKRDEYLHRHLPNQILMEMLNFQGSEKTKNSHSVGEETIEEENNDKKNVNQFFEGKSVTPNTDLIRYMEDRAKEYRDKLCADGLIDKYGDLVSQTLIYEKILPGYKPSEQPKVSFLMSESTLEVTKTPDGNLTSSSTKKHPDEKKDVNSSEAVNKKPMDLKERNQSVASNKREKSDITNTSNQADTNDTEPQLVTTITQEDEIADQLYGSQEFNDKNTEKAEGQIDVTVVDPNLVKGYRLYSESEATYANYELERKAHNDLLKTLGDRKYFTLRTNINQLFTAAEKSVSLDILELINFHVLVSNAIRIVINLDDAHSDINVKFLREGIDALSAAMNWKNVNKDASLHAPISSLTTALTETLDELEKKAVLKNTEIVPDLLISENNDEISEMVETVTSLIKSKENSGKDVAIQSLVACIRNCIDFGKNLNSINDLDNVRIYIRKLMTILKSYESDKGLHESLEILIAELLNRIFENATLALENSMNSLSTNNNNNQLLFQSTEVFKDEMKKSVKKNDLGKIQATRSLLLAKEAIDAQVDLQNTSPGNNGNTSGNDGEKNNDNDGNNNRKNPKIVSANNKIEAFLNDAIKNGPKWKKKVYAAAFLVAATLLMGAAVYLTLQTGGTFLPLAALITAKVVLPLFAIGCAFMASQEPPEMTLFASKSARKFASSAKDAVDEIEMDIVKATPHSPN